MDHSKQKEMFSVTGRLGMTNKRKKRLNKSIEKTNRKLSPPKETAKEHEAAENGGTVYWSTFRR